MNYKKFFLGLFSALHLFIIGAITTIKTWQIYWVYAPTHIKIGKKEKENLMNSQVLPYVHIFTASKLLQYAQITIYLHYNWKIIIQKHNIQFLCSAMLNMLLCNDG